MKDDEFQSKTSLLNPRLECLNQVFASCVRVGVGGIERYGTKGYPAQVSDALSGKYSEPGCTPTAPRRILNRRSSFKYYLQGLHDTYFPITETVCKK